MNKKTLAAAAALLIAGGVACPAHSTTWTATHLAEVCDSSKPVDIGICAGYITGILEVAQSEMDSGNWPSTPFCIDVHIAADETTDAIRKKVVQLVRFNPDKSQRIGSLTAVVQAASTLFPCKRS